MMSIPNRKSVSILALTTLTAVFMCTSFVHTRHRARVSKDLEQAIATDASVSVIVHGDRDAVRQLAERHGLRIKKVLRSGAVLEARGIQVEALAQDPEVDHLSNDRSVRSALDVTADTVGAAMVWNGVDALPGLSGHGIGIAVIDSGIAPHRALRGRVVRTVDFWNGAGDGNDQYGHGTHVAGIVAGDSPSSEGQRHRGMAPGAHLINLRVLGPDGSGVTSDVVEAIDWAIEHRSRYNIRIINLSLGAPVNDEFRDDPLCEAVERAVRAGIVVVASAGNAGKADDGTPIAGGIVSPGNSPYALTVGALNTRQTPWRSDDVIATYSSRGPTAIDNLVKPDLVAPGNRIVSLEAPGSAIVRDWPAAHIAGQGNDAYFLMSGSSMGTAVVSGAVALLLEANAGMDPASVKLALQLTAAPVANTGIFDAGAGSLNIVSAVRLASGAVPPDAGVESLATATFGGEQVAHAGVAFIDFGIGMSEPPVWGELIPRDLSAAGKRIVWGDAKRIVWGDAKRIVWGDAKRIVWGDAKRIVWGDAKRIVWGDGTQIWGDEGP